MSFQQPEERRVCGRTRTRRQRSLRSQGTEDWFSTATSPQGEDLLPPWFGRDLLYTADTMKQSGHPKGDGFLRTPNGREKDPPMERAGYLARRSRHKSGPVLALDKSVDSVPRRSTVEDSNDKLNNFPGGEANDDVEDQAAKSWKSAGVKAKDASDSRNGEAPKMLACHKRIELVPIHMVANGVHFHNERQIEQLGMVLVDSKQEGFHGLRGSEGSDQNENNGRLIRVAKDLNLRKCTQFLGTDVNGRRRASGGKRVSRQTELARNGRKALQLRRDVGVDTRQYGWKAQQAEDGTDMPNHSKGKTDATGEDVHELTRSETAHTAVFMQQVIVHDTVVNEDPTAPKC
ncbi:hypothetical protein CALCODRAFT_513294 [Calocera cornea HHB12733]|uniref:Uncharacterized protein n=1 Tax=Calocera cornea HHB12733 TaxID=1353952 RepID=A0A165C8Y5_9BASI|nr:hypothetical protein CALCODRAFT_513294 [Calocera cornea HHB12733]